MLVSTASQLILRLRLPANSSRSLSAHVDRSQARQVQPSAAIVGTMDVHGQETRFHVKTTDGAQLECVMSRSTTSGSQVKPVALLLFHPWAWLGGSMHDAVVSTIWGAATRAGAFNTVLKYNVRGTGTSTGRKSLGSLAADVEDALTLCSYMLCELYTPPERIYLVAYSYGSCIASHVVGGCPQVAGMVSVGFPLGFAARLFLRSQPCWHCMLAAAVPKFLVVGSEDQFTSLAHYTRLVGEYRKLQGSCQPQGAANLDVRVFENCDHFFGGRWQELGQAVLQWIQARELVAAATQDLL